MPSSSFGCGHRQLKVHLINFSQRGLQSQQFTRFRTSLPFSLRLFHLSHSRTTSLQSVSLFLGVMRHMWQSATCANHFHRGTKQFPTQLQHHWIRLMPEKRQGLLTCLLSMSEHTRNKRGNTLAKQNNAQSVATLTHAKVKNSTLISTHCSQLHHQQSVTSFYRSSSTAFPLTRRRFP